MANEKRLIDANKLITRIQGTESKVARNAPYDAEWFTRMADRQFEILEMIDNAPTVDAVEVVHGRWEPTGDPVLDNIYGVAMCSICGYEYAGNNTNYCPNCGAKMDGDGNG